MAANDVPNAMDSPPGYKSYALESTLTDALREKQLLLPLMDNGDAVVDFKTPKHDSNKESSSSSSSSSLSLLSSSITTKTVLVLMTCITILMLYLVNLRLLEAYILKHTVDRHWYVFQEAPCSQPKEHLQEMSQLAIDASSALRLLGSNPVACYGTLMGAMRLGRVLPWDNNIDLCVVNRISKDFKMIQDVFSKFDIEISEYDYWNGHFYMHRNSIDGFITVFSDCTILDDLLFSKESDLVGEESYYSNELDSDTLSESEDRDNDDDRYWVCPDGRLPYLTHIFQGDLKPIPYALLKAPFSSLRFGGNNQSVAIPHGDVEILKYFYPESWWLIVKPVGC